MGFMESSGEGRDLGDYDNIYFKTASATASSLMAGTVLGAVAANWQDVPVVQRNNPYPGLKKTAQMMGNYGLTFAAIGGTFAFVDALSESIRGKKDIFNGALGGFAAGAVLGLKAGKVPIGLGAGAAFAAISALLDYNGQQMRAPIGREYLPYPRERP
ncbi:hypothetical protein O6H91_10G031900 [Diphasiastrum complanatum]|uniref:Uncharacterized protein n=1 Tax=Diphasiastrum complanatum TaxID=34168 RepID=A0ACC2CGJ3_DIPCM|nr:hypothetical protein O6H91_10G031900 [Diphasiastrum complanatum]